MASKEDIKISGKEIRVVGDEPAADSTAAVPKANTSRYRLLGEIGEGGMGVVYKAQRAGLDRPLALKRLRRALTGDEQSRKRFEQEARAASLLTHANLVAVYDYGVDADGSYLVMDYVDGETLASLLAREGTLTPERFLNIFLQVCDALAHAHMKGVVHRDLKPSNIMITTGDTGAEVAKVLDFGIAKLLPQAQTHEQRLTQTGDVLGSPVYMSPEQCVGKALDARSDIYSLGCVMYECLAGVPPFLGDNVVQTILGHLNDVPKQISEVNPHSTASPQLEAIVSRCLHKKPAERFASVDELRATLELTDSKMTPGQREAIRRRARRRTMHAMVSRQRNWIIAFTCCMLLGCAYLAWHQQRTNSLRLYNSIISAGDIAARNNNYAECIEQRKKAIKMIESHAVQREPLELAKLYASVGKAYLNYPGSTTDIQDAAIAFDKGLKVLPSDAPMSDRLLLLEGAAGLDAYFVPNFTHEEFVKAVSNPDTLAAEGKLEEAVRAYVNLRDRTTSYERDYEQLCERTRAAFLKLPTAKQYELFELVGYQVFADAQERQQFRKKVIESQSTNSRGADFHYQRAFDFLLRGDTQAALTEARVCVYLTGNGPTRVRADALEHVTHWPSTDDPRPVTFVSEVRKRALQELIPIYATTKVDDSMDELRMTLNSLTQMYVEERDVSNARKYARTMKDHGSYGVSGERYVRSDLAVMAVIEAVAGSWNQGDKFFEQMLKDQESKEERDYLQNARRYIQLRYKADHEVARRQLERLVAKLEAEWSK